MCCCDCSDDGHGGAQTSRFLRENSYAEFEKQLEKTRDPKQAFEKAFEKLDKDYIDQCLKNPRKAGLFAGSCAVALYFDCVKNCMWVANLGDSRAVLGNVEESGWVETVELTTDHRCAHPQTAAAAAPAFAISMPSGELREPPADSVHLCVHL